MTVLPINEIIWGDCLEVMPEWPDDIVQCCISSPPYWGLRDYGIEPREWPTVTFTPVAGLPEMTIQGCEPDCEHEWGDKVPGIRRDNQHVDQALGNKGGGKKHSRKNQSSVNQGQYCQKCGGWRGCHGLEPDPWSYAAHEVLIFREVRRVLRDDGTLWLNLCSSFAGGGRGGNPDESPYRKQATNKGSLVAPSPMSYFKPKDLIDIPHMVAHALQADGWWLRQAMPWAKRNPMPESTTDRPTNALEFVFLLTKSPRYYFDMEAVRVAHARDWNPDTNGGSIGMRGSTWMVDAQGSPHGGGKPAQKNPSGRAFRNTDLWYQSVEKPFGMVGTDGELVGFDVNPQGFKDAHFATFGTEFVRPLLKAGTSQKGACPKCGAPWERVVEKSKSTDPVSHWDSGPGTHGNECRGEYRGKSRTLNEQAAARRMALNTKKARDAGGAHDMPFDKSRTVGWWPTCKCGLTETRPCIVLDIFAGSGTVGYVAAQELRDYLLIEVNPEYCDMARKRLADVEELPLVEAAKPEKGLFDAPAATEREQSSMIDNP